MAITDQHLAAYTDLMVALMPECPIDYFDEGKSRPNDRRRHLRYYVNRNCLYLVVGQMGLEHGTLYNISKSGLYIGGYHKAAVGRSATILIEPKQSVELPYVIDAVVVRDVGMTLEGIYRYGCKITSIINPNTKVGTDDVAYNQLNAAGDVIDLDNGEENDLLSDSDDIDLLRGATSNDTLLGGRSHDMVLG